MPGLKLVKAIVNLRLISRFPILKHLIWEKSVLMLTTIVFL